ncbi:MAG: TonB-dependent copper receptor [Gammaproteobacteria bacterium]|jgi:iron complex outermembrane receptor protein|nr:TonB-dependent copper receptor [Gammaproteobacteria bacterium]
MYTNKPLAIAIVAAFAQLAANASAQDSALEELVVTGVRMDQPLTLSTDPKAPRQPLPAADGADYLKTIPGFSVVRKGGSNGDPVMRGMAGSRLSMLVDGEMILGGCSGRMDPPTAYILPEAFDSIKVIKGPQSVQHGPGNSAGVVLFERSTERPEKSGWSTTGSALGGSWGRHDEVVDTTFSSPEFTFRGIATNASQDNYEDGAGNEIHSNFARWTTQVSLAWTPDDTTRLELSSARSDGEAAYADRGVDGSKFARENYNIKFTKRNLTTHIESLDAQVYYNYVDHVMDNYSLRDVVAGRTNVAMNPDRETSGGRLSMKLKPSPRTDVILGVDTQANTHTNRSSMNQTMMPYESMARIQDAEFEQRGVFTELGFDIDARQRVVTGLRLDDWQVTDNRSEVFLSMMSTAPNPTAGLTVDDTLTSGFLRYERVLDWRGANFFAGLGHSERFPDYWEMIAKESTTSVSALEAESEKTTQLDVGIIYNSGPISGSASVFYNEISDFLMIESGFAKQAASMGMTMPMPMMDMGMTSTRLASVVRNIDARSWGLEVDGQYAFNDNWKASMTLASVRGANDTDGRTLAQLPPIEGRVGLHYSNSNWTAGLLYRGLAEQTRVDIGRGNIVGQDFGPTDSANILSLNGGWQPSAKVQVTAGVDNLFDTEYAEHISRAGTAIPGFDQIARVNEPGRTLWMKAQFAF